MFQSSNLIYLAMSGETSTTDQRITDLPKSTVSNAQHNDNADLESTASFASVTKTTVTTDIIESATSNHQHDNNVEPETTTSINSAIKTAFTTVTSDSAMSSIQHHNIVDPETTTDLSSLIKTALTTEFLKSATSNAQHPHNTNLKTRTSFATAQVTELATIFSTKPRGTHLPKPHHSTTHIPTPIHSPSSIATMTRLPYSNTNSTSSVSSASATADSSSSRHTTGIGVHGVIPWWGICLICGILAFILGCAVGFFVARRKYAKAGARDRGQDDDRNPNDLDGAYDGQKGGMGKEKKRGYLAALFGSGKAKGGGGERGQPGEFNEDGSDDGQGREGGERGGEKRKKKGGFLSSCFGSRKKGKGDRSSVEGYQNDRDSRVGGGDDYDDNQRDC